MNVHIYIYIYTHVYTYIYMVTPPTRTYLFKEQGVRMIKLQEIGKVCPGQGWWWISKKKKEKYEKQEKLKDKQETH